MDSMTLAVVGAAYGTSIVVGISRNAWRQRSHRDASLALFAACGVTAILTIILGHRAESATAVAILERLESIATLASGPALLLYIRALDERFSWRRAELAHFLPALAAAIVPAATAIPIEILVLHQTAYTILGVIVPARRDAPPRHAILSRLLLGTMIAVHVAQLARIATRGSHRLLDVVPVTVSLAILIVSAFAVLVWIAGIVTPPSRARRAARDSDASGILDRLERAMREAHLYRQPDLGLHDLARALEVTPHELSEALNVSAGTSLPEYLGRFRVDDARRRLLDPEHAIYTIEAIGAMSGFGSRSSFHAVFRREAGMTPSRFRKEG